MLFELNENKIYQNLWDAEINAYMEMYSIKSIIQKKVKDLIILII